MMGVDYDLFWTLNPKSLQPFIKAFELKQKNNDTMAWQFGQYVRMAIASVLSKDGKYPQKPILSKDEVVAKQMSAEEIKARFMAHAQRINARFGKE